MWDRLSKYEVLDSICDKRQVMCADRFCRKSLRECGSHFGEYSAEFNRPFSFINDPDSCASSIGKCFNFLYCKVVNVKDILLPQIDIFLKFLFWIIDHIYVLMALEKKNLHFEKVNKICEK